MAKQEFLDNFRVARNLFHHPRVRTDSLPLDPQALGQRVARAAIWLTPKSVEEFDADDFPELGPARQAELRNAISDFLGVAKQVPPADAATPDQLSQATGAFGRMLSILEPYMPASDEVRKIEEALEKVEFPPWIPNWDYELGSDHDGLPAVWINLFADETSAPRKEFGRVASRLNREIREALVAVGSDRWPYVRMWTAVEYKMA